jgi:hypothetical protein
VGKEIRTFEDSQVLGGTKSMRLSAIVPTKIVPAIAITLSLGASFLAPVNEAHANEFVVSSQVVSDEAAGGYVGDMASSDTAYGGESIVEDGSSFGGYGMNERTYGQPDLFYNYYTQGYANRANAQMYLSPGPVPAHVGHTYYTYQPFHPEEYLYWHKNRFHNYYDNGRGMNRTRAIYYAPPVKTALSNLYWNKIRLPR